MARKYVAIDDETGAVAAEANPGGWLVVTVAQMHGDTPMELTFGSWTSFRHWVEKSDPACGVPLNPPPAK